VRPERPTDHLPPSSAAVTIVSFQGVRRNVAHICKVYFARLNLSIILLFAPCTIYIYTHIYIYIYIYIVVHLVGYVLFHYIYIYIHTQGVPGGMDLTSGECSLGQTIPI